MGLPDGGQSNGRLGASVGVVVLLALIWAMVLVPPALLSHAARKEAFVVSFGAVAPPVQHRAAGARSSRVQCRRRIAGGLLLAAAAALLVGLLPAFRVLLVVHLFLLDSFLAYIALLAHMAQRAARAGAREAGEAPIDVPARMPARPRRGWRTGEGRGTAVLHELGPAQVG